MVKKSATKPKASRSPAKSEPAKRPVQFSAEASALVELLASGAEPRQALVARALLDQQDAEHALREARALQAKATGHGPQQRLRAVEDEEETAIDLHRQAEEELRLASRILAEAEANWAAAEQARAEALSLRAQAGQHVKGARAEADEAYEQAMTKARALADEDRDRSLITQNAAIVAERHRTEEEFRLALRHIDEMQRAVQAELEAQQSLTTAIRLNAIARASAGTS